MKIVFIQGTSIQNFIKIRPYLKSPGGSKVLQTNRQADRQTFSNSIPTEVFTFRKDDKTRPVSFDSTINLFDNSLFGILLCSIDSQGLDHLQDGWEKMKKQWKWKRYRNQIFCGLVLLYFLPKILKSFKLTTKSVE